MDRRHAPHSHHRWAVQARQPAARGGSGRVDDRTRQVLAELRLVFHVMARPRRFHEPYLAGNRELYRLLVAGDLDAAVHRLSEYLDAAERQLVEAFTS